MSLGDDTYNNQVRLKVEEKMSKGIILVASAGNDGARDNQYNYPAGYGALSVSATNEWGYYTDFTTFNTGVDIAAPGEDVLSLSSTLTSSDLYSIKSGTYVVLF